MSGKSFDKFVIVLFYISISIGLYFNVLSQSSGLERSSAPLPVLLLPFGIAALQLIRILSLCGKWKIDSLSMTWVYIFIYYLFALFFGFTIGSGVIDYNTIWLVICPPVTWVYFTLIIKATPSLKETLVKWNFWVLIVFSAISLYFIPRSINAKNLFASLNTGYFVLFVFPMVLLDKSKVKKVIAGVLMVIVVMLSMKRGGYLAVAIAYVLYILLAAKTNLLKKIIAVIICLVALYYLLPKINDITNGTLQARYEFSQSEGDEEGRAAMYPKVWNAVWDSSLIEEVFGHGHRAVVANKVLYGLSAHNDYLEFLYDYGVIGLILLLIYQCKIIKLTYQTRKNKTDFLATIFGLSPIIVLSMVSVVYAYAYFLVIIPFWCIINNDYHISKSRNNSNENRNLNIQ